MLNINANENEPNFSIFPKLLKKKWNELQIQFIYLKKKIPRFYTVDLNFDHN